MKERFELKYNEQRMRHYAVDHERKTQLSHEDMINLLNEQDQKIKELEEERKQLKLELKMFKSVNEFINGYSIEKAREVLLQSEKTKKQAQNSKAIEVLENTKEVLTDVIAYVIEENSINDRLCYFKEISSNFNDKVNNFLVELNKGDKINGN